MVHAPHFIFESTNHLLKSLRKGQKVADKTKAIYWANLIEHKFVISCSKINMRWVKFCWMTPNYCSGNFLTTFSIWKVANRAQESYATFLFVLKSLSNLVLVLHDFNQTVKSMEMILPTFSCFFWTVFDIFFGSTSF